jgi:hypothetical protein
VIPFILLQVFMVFVVYFVPDLVTHYKDTLPQADPADVRRQLENLVIPGLGGPGDMPPPRF